ncbi:MAG: hypothetical protein ACRD2O_10200 [Terriglobia bacterium]
MPRLNGAALEHQVAGKDPRALSLARTLTELNIADPSHWQHRASPYLLETLQRWMALHGGDVARKEFFLHATLSNYPDPYGGDDLDPPRLYLTVEAEEAGYIVIGPTLEMLASVHPRLPATFYRLLVGSIGCWVRVYDYSDALERVEMWKEWIQQEENPDQYEIPDIDGCIPPEMRQKPLKAEDLQDLLSGFKNDDVRCLVQAALDINQVSRRRDPPEITEQSREALMDCNPPLPALLVSFKRQDAVVGTFDEEMESALEATPEPSFLAEINPQDPASVRQAFDCLATLCNTLAAASRLAKLLPGNNPEG